MDSSPFFNEYEKGLLTDDEFRGSVRRALHRELTDDEIDAAWNAMLGAIPLERLQLLKNLRNHYRIFLLSNTNNIHLQSFNKTILAVSGEPDLQAFFEHAHYSHVLKMRKPDLEIFEHVLKQHHLNPEHTMFLDDNLSNLQGASNAGIKTFHVVDPEKMMALFS
jgi:HAD superfamily hydrolase (TIGR01509 family)